MTPFDINDTILDKKSKIYQELFDRNSFEQHPYTDIDQIPYSILNKTLGIIPAPHISFNHIDEEGINNVTNTVVFTFDINIFLPDDVYFFIYSVNMNKIRGITLKNYEVDLYYDNLLSNQREERINLII